MLITAAFKVKAATALHRTSPPAQTRRTFHPQLSPLAIKMATTNNHIATTDPVTGDYVLPPADEGLTRDGINAEGTQALHASFDDGDSYAMLPGGRTAHPRSSEHDGLDLDNRTSDEYDQLYVFSSSVCHITKTVSQCRSQLDRIATPPPTCQVTQPCLRFCT